MFFDFGAGELVGLAILAMILIGPERLPSLAVDAAKFVKRIREMASKATEDLKPTDLNPKSFIKKQLSSVLDDDDSTPATSKRTSTIDPDLL